MWNQYALDGASALHPTQSRASGCKSTIITTVGPSFAPQYSCPVQMARASACPVMLGNSTMLTSVARSVPQVQPLLPPPVLHGSLPGPFRPGLPRPLTRPRHNRGSRQLGSCTSPTCIRQRADGVGASVPPLLQVCSPCTSLTAQHGARCTQHATLSMHPQPTTWTTNALLARVSEWGFARAQCSRVVCSSVCCLQLQHHICTITHFCRSGPAFVCVQRTCQSCRG
jgi:hypothetical protein